MAEYYCTDMKTIKKGDILGIDIPKPIASVSFDAREAGTYIVVVRPDGSYMVNYAGQS